MSCDRGGLPPHHFRKEEQQVVPPRHPQPVLATVGDIEEAPATADHTIVAITILGGL